MFRPVRDLGSGGVNTDILPHDLPPNQVSNALNVVFRDGAIRKSPGYIKAFDTDAIETPYWMASWTVNGEPQIAYATDTKLFKSISGTLTDSTNTTDYPAGYTGSAADKWFAEIFGQTVIFTNGTDVPQVFRPQDAAFINMPNWLSTLRAEIIRPFKSFLIALRIVDNGTVDNHRIWWSDAAPIDGLPATWDPADISALAGFNGIQASDGEIRDGLALGDSFMIYTDYACYSMQFVGGQFVFAFRKVHDNGLINRNCVASFDNYHFCVGNEIIYIHDGNRVQHIAKNRVLRRFFSEVGDISQVRVASDPIQKEILVYYPEEGEASRNKCLKWNWQDDTFSFESVPDVACVVFGPRLFDITTWDEATEAWDLWATEWSALSHGDVRPVTHYLSTADKAIYVQSRNFLRNGVPYTSQVERVGVDMDMLLQTTTRNVKRIKRVLPQIKGSGTVQFQFGAHNSPNGAIRWGTPINYNIDSDYKVDLRLTGRYMAYRITSQNDGYWEFSGFDVDADERGSR